MNDNPPFPFHRGGFEVGPVYFHHGGPPALAWATFALVLLLVLAVFAMIVARIAVDRRHQWKQQMAFAGPGGPHDPLELLRMRYARGEIDRDAFLQGTTDLTEPKPGG
ncbi:MAG TPA: SHOCT domain-containing protein [Gaiellaceae bacterium]|nr:SHOCT domain-containing protein [Gaiellaceae bacterium]